MNLNKRQLYDESIHTGYALNKDDNNTALNGDKNIARVLIIQPVLLIHLLSYII